MLVKLAPPTLSDLLLHSAWFPTLDSAAQQRVMDDVREVEVPQGGALCRRGRTGEDDDGGGQQGDERGTDAHGVTITRHRRQM